MDIIVQLTILIIKLYVYQSTSIIPGNTNETGKNSPEILNTYLGEMLKSRKMKIANLLIKQK